MWRVLLLVVASMLTGCAVLVNDIQKEITSRDLPQELKLLVYRSEPILQCVKGVGGHCDPGKPLVETGVPRTAVVSRALKQLDISSFRAESKSTGLHAGAVAAYDATVDPTEIKLHKFFRRSMGITEDSDNLKLGKDELAAYARSIHEATSLGGWLALADQTRERSQTLRSRGQNDEADAADAAIQQLKLVDAYFLAYFSNGKFVSLTIDAAKFEDSAVAELKTKLGVSEKTAKELVAKLLSQTLGKVPDDKGKYQLLTKLSDGGFVTRGGTKYSFPGLSVTFDPMSDTAIQVSKIDFTQVGADVIRVYLEALADGWGQLPGESSSTACVAKKAKQLEEYKQLKCYVESEQQVNATDFATVNDYANRAESFAATSTGQVIRGMSWVSLNNEALAKLIETAVGVIARKATEKVTWCYFACKAEEEKTAKREHRTIRASPAAEAEVVKVLIHK